LISCTWRKYSNFAKQLLNILQDPACLNLYMSKQVWDDIALDLVASGAYSPTIWGRKPIDPREGNLKSEDWSNFLLVYLIPVLTVFAVPSIGAHRVRIIAKTVNALQLITFRREITEDELDKGWKRINNST
jgi:hypothetical protein